MKRNYLIKIIPPKGYSVYRIEFARRHIIGVVLFALLAVGGAAGTHWYQLHAAQEEAARLAAVAAEQQAALATIDEQTRQLGAQLDAIRKRNEEIRRAMGIAPKHPPARRPEQQSNAASGAPTMAAVEARVTSLLHASAAAHVEESQLQRVAFRVLNLRHVAQVARAEMLAAIPSINPAGDATIASGFGYRSSPWPEFHNGVDLDADYGSTVRAAAAGTVVAAGWDDGGFGIKVEIDHGNGYHTLYAHCSKVEVAAGQRVVKGQPIALVGATGEATGAHLHYQVMRDGTPVDPAPYLDGVPPSVLASLQH